MNESYWPGYYSNKKRATPSDFARFCVNRIPHGSTILDIGAGDGRDASLLKTRGQVIAIDPNSNLNEDPELTDVVFRNQTLEDFISNKKDDVIASVIYARWFIHAVEEPIEDVLLDFVARNKATLMAEFRIVGDDTVDDTHDRRLIDPTVFAAKLIDRNFKVKYAVSGRGFSKYGDDDPLLARLIVSV